MKYRVIDRKTQKDITNDEMWVIRPDGKLYALEYCDLIGRPDAMYITLAQDAAPAERNIFSDI